MEEEIWKDIQNYTGKYQISNKGRVKSLDRVDSNNHRIRERILKYNKDKNNRYYVSLYNSMTRTHDQISTLVLEAFVGPKPEGMECCHNDGNPQNNNLDNLRWDTHYNNMQDKNLHNTHPKGETHKNSKLKETEVIFIWYLIHKGINQRIISKMFKISPSTINDIYKGRCWKKLYDIYNRGTLPIFEPMELS